MRGPNLGLLALVVAAGGLLSGVFLALNYAPTLEAAHDSVAYIESSVLLGAFLRGLHHWAGTFAIVLAAGHGARLFWHGAYKAPRRKLWVLGGLVLVVLVGFAYTGYLLPGDARAYTGMGVMADVAGSTPVVGDAAASVTRGGAAVSSAMLTRIYVVHIVLLPVALVVLVLLFLAELRKVDPLPAGALARDAVGTAVVLVLLGLAAWLLPPELGDKADPAAATVDGKPEWFLLWVNELLRRIPGNTFLIAAALPGLLVVLALALPWLARGEKRDPSARKPEIATAAAIVAVLVGLTAVSLASGRSEAPVEVEPPVADGADIEEQAAPLLKRFQCRDCHIIDGGKGDEYPEDYTGPPLNRAEANQLYTREYFRRKVGDPLAFWSETQMYYSPKRLKPTPDQLAVLERWFFEGRK